LLAPAVLKVFTTKLTILSGFSLFLFYIVTNFYPMYYVLLPVSLLLGLMSGPMWSAQATHLTTLAIRYGQMKEHSKSDEYNLNTFSVTAGQNHNGVQPVAVDNNGNSPIIGKHTMPCYQSTQSSYTRVSQPSQSVSNTAERRSLFVQAAEETAFIHNKLHPYEPTINMFNGIFWSVFQTCHIFGNLLSFTLLSASTNSTLVPHSLPSNFSPLFCGSSDCGVHDYPDTNLPHHLAPVAMDTRHVLLTVYLCFSLLAMVLVIIQLDKQQVHTSGTKASMSCHQLSLESVRMFADFRLQLLLPLVIFTGLQQAFVHGDFTKVTKWHVLTQ